MGYMKSSHVDGISRSHGWDKEIPHSVLPMGQLVLSEKWKRKIYVIAESINVNYYYSNKIVGL